jgi:enoyl-CoA hydratase
LLNELVEPEELIPAAQRLASSLNENSEYGVWMTKKGFWSNINASGLRQATELENRTQVLGYYTGCMEESMRAFAEGRKPKWEPL